MSKSPERRLQAQIDRARNTWQWACVSYWETAVSTWRTPLGRQAEASVWLSYYSEQARRFKIAYETLLTLRDQ